MNFKEGEVLYFDKPLKWTSFAVVNKIRYHICRKLGVKKIKVVGQLIAEVSADKLEEILKAVPEAQVVGVCGLKMRRVLPAECVIC